MPTKTQEWKEGKSAYRAGATEQQCPYDMHREWERWADWTCGYGEALNEAATHATTSDGEP